MTIRFLAATLSVFCIHTAVYAQDSDSDFQAWTALALSGSVSESSRFLVWFDGHARFRDDASDLGVSILRPGIGWRVNDNLNLWAGYARVVSRSDDAPDIEEDRIWQQATYPVTKVFGGNLSARTRLEQRFRDTGNDTGWRLRQFFRWERRINASQFSPVIWNEFFVNINDTDWGQASGFDQNRLFVGAAWRFSDKARLEGGYLNNLLNSAGGSDRVNHNISMALFISL